MHGRKNIKLNENSPSLSTFFTWKKTLTPFICDVFPLFCCGRTVGRNETANYNYSQL